MACLSALLYLKWQVSMLLRPLSHWHIILMIQTLIPSCTMCLVHIFILCMQHFTQYSLWGRRSYCMGEQRPGFAFKIAKLMLWTWRIIQLWPSSLKPSDNLWTDSAGNTLSGLFLISSNVLSLELNVFHPWNTFCRLGTESLVLCVLKSSRSIADLCDMFHIPSLQGSHTYLL